MARHDQYTNDPVLTTGLQLHTPDFTGTSAQRQAYTTSALITGMQWTETDTLLTWKWNGSSWALFGSAGGNGTFPYALTLLTGQIYTLATGYYAAII